MDEKTEESVEVKMEEFIRLTNSRVRELESRLAELEADRDAWKSLAQHNFGAAEIHDKRVDEALCRLAEANALCIKLAHQKGGQVDEIRALKNCYRAASEWCDDVEKLERTANPINILLPVKKLTELEASLRGGG